MSTLASSPVGGNLSKVLEVQYPNEASEFTYVRTYARWIEELKRRERWPESVQRYLDFIWEHLGDKVPTKVYRHMKKAMLLFGVMPSMRALWTAGPAASVDNVCTYNCSYQAIDKIEAFSECLYILMCGSGYGFSVEACHTEKLPVVKEMKFKPVLDKHVVPDSRAGWADSVKELMERLYEGFDLDMDYSQIRPRGARLHTMGGRASGPEPLVGLHNFIREIFNGAQGRKLKPLECHDIINEIGQTVVAGGVRRSSQMSISDLDDIEMARAKIWPFPQRRQIANNSAAYVSKPTAPEFLREWSILASSGTGERGIFNRLSTQQHSPSRRDSSLIMGTNPCVPGDTWVSTDKGPRQVHELIGKPFNAVVGARPYEASGFWATGEKPLLKIQTHRGYELRCTENHEINVERSRKRIKNGVQPTREWVKAGDLKPGDKLVLNDMTGFCHARRKTVSDDGWLLGLMVGDGGFNPSKYPGYVRFWGDNQLELSAKASQIIYDRACPQYKGPQSNNANNSSQVGTVALDKLASPYITAGDKDILPALEKESESFVRGFLRGFFDADGTVIGDLKKGISVRLAQSDLIRLTAVQRMVLRSGIASTIYQNRREAGTHKLPDGHGGLKDYPIKAQHELVISRENVDSFAWMIGFADPDKKEKLHTLLSSRKRDAYRDSYTTAVVSIEPDGVEMVYDCTVQDVHCFDANGVLVHNCGEIGLRSEQFCNLSEVVVRGSDDLEMLFKKTETAVWMGVIQSTFTYFPYLNGAWKANCEEERLCGVSLTGQMDNRSLLSPDALSHMKRKAQRVAFHAAEKLGVGMPTAITCGKPSGTVSQLVNSASGGHARFAPFYIRRYRISATDPLLHLLRDFGVEAVPENGERLQDWEKAVSAEEGKRDICTIYEEGEVWDPDKVRTWVVSFPVRSSENSVFRDQVSAIDQLEHYKKLQNNWCEHNASCTVYVKDDEWFEVGAWVYRNWEIVSGIAFLPHNGGKYEQAPFEEIDEEEYEYMVQAMPKIDYSQLSRYEDADNTSGAKTYACHGDKCEIES